MTQSRGASFSIFTVHHISFFPFVLFDEQVFLFTESAEGRHNNLLPLHQLENYSAHKILYSSASSISVKKMYFAAPANLPQLWQWSYLFLVFTVISQGVVNNINEL